MRFDFHVHTNVSPDSNAPIADVVQTAIEKGLSGVCFTDHCDLIDGEVPGRPVPESYTRWMKSHAEIEAARAKWGGQIEILHGMELGEIVQAPEAAARAAETPGLDFILGSVHAVTGWKDFYFLDYTDHDTCRKLADLYLDDHIRMAELNLMDAVGHIGYFNRYMTQAGLYVDMMDYEEKLRHVFQILARNGRGIEINTSGLRRNPGPHFLIPDLPALKLFRECGGEIVTTGSDAHMATHVGCHLAEAEQLLRAADFQYMTIFRDRKPEFLRL